MRLWRVRDTISEIRVNRSATRECVHVAHYSCVSTCTHSRKCTRRLLNKQGGKNCGAPVLCWQGEVEMTYNYPSCHVCDESVTTACLFVKHDRGRSGRRLSLRGLGVNKSGRCCTVTPADSLDDAVAVFAAISYTRKSRLESFFIARLFWWTPMQKQIWHNKTPSYLSSANFIFGKQACSGFVMTRTWFVEQMCFLATHLKTKPPWVCVAQALLLWLRVWCLVHRETAFLYVGYATGCLNNDWDSKKGSHLLLLYIWKVANVICAKI